MRVGQGALNIGETHIKRVSKEGVAAQHLLPSTHIHTYIDPPTAHDMRFPSILTVAVASLLAHPFAYAFPALARMSGEELDAMAKRFMQDQPQARQLQIPTVGRKQIPDADHPFIAPSATAQRGPCPGLNIMANHGYINREGITTFEELLYGQQEAMGWAIDLATLLAAIAVAVDGNPVTNQVSIGGPDARVGTIPLLSGSTTLPGGE
jgi:hypothetical protein